MFSAHELNPLVHAIDRVLYLGAGTAVLGAVDEVVTGPVLSRLYGAEIEVVRIKDRMFVMAGDVDVEREAHRHDHDDGARPDATIRITPRMFDYDFMRTAFAAAGIVALLAGMVGFFLVLRGQTFAGHALSHVGFTGATGAVLFGLSPLAGLVGFTVLGGIGMGVLGEKLSERDVAIGMMLSLALGFGLLFLHFYTSDATQAAALLFGNVLGVDECGAGHARRAVVRQPGRARRDRPSADLRLPAKRTRRGRGVPLRFVSTGVSGDRRDCGRRMRADRRRACWCSR